jgi:NAD(P)-dependent dehydrogenase (short-subunit alcohol dehydrogenase family)
MELNLKNKVVVITGGAQGIGRAMAEGYLKEGCTVAICDINKNALKEATEYFKGLNFEIITEALDVCDNKAVNAFAEKLYDTYGHLDVWLNNAGILFPKGILEQDLEDFERVIRVNLSSTFNGTQAAGRQMKKSGGGVIINTASFAGILPTAFRCSYAASKAGIIAFTKETAAELAPHNIRVVAIAPGMVEVGMMKERLQSDEREKIISRIAMRRCAQPSEVADLVVFLASDAAAYLSGSVYEITGGQNCIQDVMSPWGLY